MKKFEIKPDTANAGANSDALESLLRNARGDGFTGAETEQVWSRLGLALGAGAAHSGLNSSTGSLPPKALGVLGAKTKMLLLVGGGVVAAGLAAIGIAGVAMHRSPQVVESRAGARATATATGNGPSSLPAIDTVPVGNLGGATALGALDNPLAALAQGGAPALPPFAQALNQPLPKKVESAARSSVDVRMGMSKMAQSAGVDKKAVDTNTEASESKEAAPAVQPPPVADPVLNEGSLLLRARRQIASNPAETLKLTEEHARVFPSGTLVPERDVLAIEALVQLGRLSDARARLAAFRTHFPQSPHLARLEGLVAQ